MPYERYYQQDCSTGRCQPQYDGGAVYQDMRDNYGQYGDSRGGCRPCDRRYGNGGRGVETAESLGVQQYEQTLETTYTKAHRITDRNNYRENLWTAAEQGKPIVMTFGRSGDPGNKQVLEAVARAKEQSGGKAEFMYVDLDKVDPNSPIGKYARDYIGNTPRYGYRTALTMVFTQKQGEGNTPVIPERPLHWQHGANLDERALLAGIDQAAQIQQKLKTGREKTPEKIDPPEKVDPKPPEAEKPKGTADVIAESLKPYGEQKYDQLFKGMTPEQRIKVCTDAIEFADKQNNPRLSAQVRAMVGLASIQWGGEAAAAGRHDEAEKHFLRGSEYIMSAGVYNKDIFQYPGFAKALRESKLPGNGANFLIEKGAADSSRPAGQKPWFFPTEQESKTNPNAFQDARDRYIAALKVEMKKGTTTVPPKSPIKR